MPRSVRLAITDPHIFSVEDTALQLSWGDLPPGHLTVSSGERHVEREHPGGAGALVLDGLAPGTPQHVEVRLRRGGGAVDVTRLHTRTLDPPAGAELFRFATVNDLHIGLDNFGFLSTIREVDTDVAHPERCLTAALDEATLWGAQRLIVKGDICDASHAHNWETAARIIRDSRLDTDLICGNHDVGARSTVDPFAEAARLGLRLHRDVTALDLPGLRVVLMDSSVPGIDIGRWTHHRDAVADAVAEVDHAMIATHHQPQPARVPTYLPWGIPGPTARRFARTIGRANPQVFGTSGHTHRNRLYRLGDIGWGEVGSTKDYPGVWAGYVVHEGGVRQVIRRIERHDCIQWTEHTRRAAAYAWGAWSPGHLGDRVVVRQWTKDRVSSN